MPAPGRSSTARAYGKLTHLAWGPAELRFAEQIHERQYDLRASLTATYRALRDAGGAAGEELELQPSGARVRVRGVQVHGRPQAAAVAGQRAAINLSGVEVQDLSRGQALVTPGAFEETRLADAVVEVIAGARPLKHGARVRQAHAPGMGSG